MGLQHVPGGSQGTSLLGYSRFKGPRLAWPTGPYWFSQALSVHKACGQSLQPIQGWLQLPWELLGTKFPQGKATSWATLKA